MSGRTVRTTLLAAAAVLVLSACGGSSSRRSTAATRPAPATHAAAARSAAQSAARIAADAKAALFALSSVRMSGTLGTAATRYRFDLHLESGTGAIGTLAFGGFSLRLVTLSNALYVNASQAFWRQYGNAGAARLLGGRWLKAAEGGDFSVLRRLTDIRALFSGHQQSRGPIIETGEMTVNGRRVLGLLQARSGTEEYVTTAATHYLVEIDKHGTKTSPTSGRIYFSDFNAPLKITAPKHAIRVGQLTTEPGAD